MKLLGLFALVLSVNFMGSTRCERLTKDELTKSDELMRSIPTSERAIFLAYSLGQGYMEELNSHIFKKFPFPILLRIPKSLENKFQALQKPENFSRSLYNFVVNTYKLTSRQMFGLVLFKKHCFPHGHCVDLENIGELCCPF